MALRSRLPMIVAGTYTAIVFLLFVLAIVTHDEFGYSFIPVLYTTGPVSLFLEWHIALDNTFVAIAAGGVANAGLLYALAKVVSLKASRRTK